MLLFLSCYFLLELSFLFERGGSPNSPIVREKVPRKSTYSDPSNKKIMDEKSYDTKFMIKIVTTIFF